MTEAQVTASIEDAEAAFAAGNHQLARQIALDLAQSSSSPQRQRAAQLLERLSPAPLGKYLLLLTAVLLIAVTVFAYSQ